MMGIFCMPNAAGTRPALSPMGRLRRASEQERAKAYTLGPLGDVGDACGAMWSKNALGMKANSNHALKGQQNSNYEDYH